ncbi:DUF4190 domain-containing protein [Actinoplanes couchii]|uniref:DUF4190 domain-containing protein n=1 Tax=Actinoplanes couchii TaxID=403638 RepID=A0ABQ3XS65_9ACTN|nr:DUF4190 domain-containing protein [Actinoplanes couchii]MDR6317943.1 uncharacterized protein YqgC (DUF456 family) [Actinoplanes couchii]GID61352.1 hypothetical protein Aco03nite_097560 [Actinoplanes couchii]
MSYPPPGQPDPYGQYPPQPYPQQPQYHGHYRPYPPQPGYYPPMPMVVPTSGLAVASMVLGIIGIFGGFCAFGVPCLIAVVLGHMALRETRNGHRAGHGMAIAGLILGYLVLIPSIVVIAMGGIGAVLTEFAPSMAP